MALQVHVWSDVACPWCYVGKKRLKTAAANLGVELELIWHSFELDPRPVPQSRDFDYVGYLAKKYGRTREQAQGMIDNMAHVGLEEGIPFDFANAIFANTFNAHRLLKWCEAETPKKQSELAAALFDAHLCEGRDLNDSSVLLSIVGRAELDVDRASAVLASDEFGDDVRRDEAAARELGVSGVPFYAIGKYGVGGAQRPESFERVLKRALGDEEESGAEEGALCGPDGC